MVRRVAKLPVGDTTRSTIAPEVESPHKVDPQVQKNLLEEFEDLFPGSLLGLPPNRRV